MLSTNMFPKSPKLRKPCKRATSASNPCIYEIPSASDGSGIIGELELVAKDIGASTDF